MDRPEIYPGALPRSLDVLSGWQATGIALGYALQAALGTATWVDGLACTPTTPASLQVIVGPGAIGFLTVVEQTAYGGLPADTVDPLVKCGINITSNTFTITPPGTVGQSQNYLIAAAFSETDVSPVLLPYLNSANPSQPYQGPNNSGVPQNTQRIQRVALQLVAGVPAATGSQTTPATPVGYVPLWVITVAQGQTTITAGNIVKAAGAPFIGLKIPQLQVTNNLAAMGNNGSLTLPTGVIIQQFYTPIVNVAAINTVYTYSSTFPIAFPTACSFISITDGGFSGLNWEAINVATLTRSGWTGYVSTSTITTPTARGYCFAIGY